jgi:hypothetical protein
MRAAASGVMFRWRKRMTDLQKAAQQLMEVVLGFAYHGKADRWADAVKAYFAALTQEQEQKPVAWISKKSLIRLRVLDATVYPDGGFDDAVALYTAPPRRDWQGLTEEEIQSLHDYYVKRLGPVEFACAIDAKLKEKNK